VSSNNHPMACYKGYVVDVTILFDSRQKKWVDQVPEIKSNVYTYCFTGQNANLWLCCYCSRIIKLDLQLTQSSCNELQHAASLSRSCGRDGIGCSAACKWRGAACVWCKACWCGVHDAAWEAYWVHLLVGPQQYVVITSYNKLLSTQLWILNSKTDKNILKYSL